MSFETKVKSKMIKDTFYTLIPVNRLLRIFVLSSVKRKENKLVQGWCLTENIIVLSVMLIVNIFFLVNKIQRFEGYINKGPLKFIDTLQLTYLLGYIEYIINLVFIYKARHTCLKYLHFYANIDKILGVPNFSQIRNKNMTALALFIISFMVSSSLDYASWLMGLGWILPTLYSLDYIYTFINAMTILDLITNVVQIEYRLKVMIGVIEDCSTSYFSFGMGEAVDDGWVSERMTVNKIGVDRLRTVSYNKCFRILSLSKYYVLLIEQVTYINKAYGIRVLASCLNLLIILIYLTNVIIRISLGLLSEYVNPRSIFYMPEVTTTLRIINYASILLILVYHCERTYKLCNNIVRLIDLTVISTKIPEDLKTSLMELRALVLSRPIKFHGANFFTLDYPLLVSVASVVVTYTIILLQSMQ